LYSNYRLRTAIEQHTTAKRFEISMVKILKHLPFTSYIENESEQDLVFAFHLLRQTEKDGDTFMSNADEALQIFRDVEQKSGEQQPKHSAWARLQILKILFRRPWGEMQKELSLSYAEKLSKDVSTNVFDKDDLSTAHEDLAIFYSRMNLQDDVSRHVAMADAIDTQQYETTISDALKFIRRQRIQMASCIAGFAADETSLKWETKNNPKEAKVVTEYFLRDQYYQAWDVALTKTTMLASKEKSCQDLVVNYRKLME